jgi:hypothetical protein
MYLFIARLKETGSIKVPGSVDAPLGTGIGGSTMDRLGVPVPKATLLPMAGRTAVLGKCPGLRPASLAIHTGRQSHYFYFLYGTSLVQLMHTVPHTDAGSDLAPCSFFYLSVRTWDPSTDISRLPVITLHDPSNSYVFVHCRGATVWAAFPQPLPAASFPNTAALAK